MMKTKKSYFYYMYIFFLILLVWFIFMPVISVVLESVFSDEGIGIKISEIKRTLTYLNNSLKVSIVVTIFSTFFGFIIAFTLYRIKFPLNNVLKKLILLPLFNPPFGNTVVFIMLFGKRGVITHNLLGLNKSPFGYKGIVVMQTISLVVLAYILISSAIQKVDTNLEDAARNLGATEKTIFFTITIPMMLPEILSAALLVFLSSMADFGTPLIIGGPYQTLASDLYIQIIGQYDMRQASISGVFLLIPCLLAFLFQRHILSKKGYSIKNTENKSICYRNLNKTIKIIFVCITYVFIAFVTIQYILIVQGAFVTKWGSDYSFTLNNFRMALKNGFKPFGNSIKLSIVASIISSFMGILISYLINRGNYKFNKLADFLVVLPSAVPGILFGIAYLVAFSRPPLILIGTEIVIYIICISRSLSVAYKSGSSILQHTEEDIEIAAYNLGASEIRTFRDITSPILKPAFEASMTKAISKNMVTLGAIIFFLLPSNKVAVQMIFQVLTSSSISEASALSVMLSFISILLVLALKIVFNGNHLKRIFLINKND